ncbi:hypothetical protein GGR56DRAFT_388246 [Xylariaceae sp. FL0804]|nr:hypothetical protein GGR56DRAFT_388246 [Xylariaceae sp. FL0804]
MPDGCCRDGTLHVLPKDLLEVQLGQIDLLTSMYAAEDAVLIDETTQRVVDQLKEWCEGVRDTSPVLSDEALLVLLELPISGQHSLRLEIAVPVASGRDIDHDMLGESPPVKIRARQPEWMSKTETFRLNGEIPQDEDLFTCIEHVKEKASQQLSRSIEAQTNTGASFKSSDPSESSEETSRVWFYFPSISTREKRDDLVNHAPRYGLTGFLLAGKPGILCLEGASRRIDEFMRFIKTESWGDIPPQHKKVSERYRESGLDVRPAFGGMQEITGLVGERRGERANRGDMKALEAWLTERGLGEAFTRVLI